MTHVVSLLATMSQNDPSLRSEVQSQLARLAQATLELTSPHAVQYSSTVAASSSRKPSKRQASIDDDDDLDAEDNDDDDDNVKEDSPFEEEEDGIATINEDVEIVPTKSSHKRKNTGGDKKGEQVHKKGKMNSLSLMTPPIGNHGKVTVKEGQRKNRHEPRHDIDGNHYQLFPFALVRYYPNIRGSFTQNTSFEVYTLFLI
ncbi:hypothetical protein BCR33DRAFT_424964 [Rhizoclosmatium globosum]|uniref:Uncharacterized protein n=1 Tax=Rhizoclosmatium globosum TaxID=329046 RepID=A0A1Y2BUT7_9FUNG|nr:hypothetical protein BCR33DRAFT_424964 [Rhizoclosmatium globosum]|eukprot:ORY38538.1 hypothetical protein BCR33DRAFT_424964 [Rhizoclosmatium globosum]